MADPHTVVPKLSGDDLMEATDEMHPVLQSVFENGYLKGYAAGEAAAVARILQAARPSANAQAPNVTRSAQPPPPRQGTATHKLIQTVLQEAGSTGATPIEIARSSANKHKAGRSGIGKILRRGTKSGQFVAVGDGRYALSKMGAIK
jgi:hypothetical protein